MMSEPRYEYEVAMRGNVTEAIKADNFFITEGFLQFSVLRGDASEDRVAAFPVAHVRSVKLKSPS